MIDASRLKRINNITSKIKLRLRPDNTILKDVDACVSAINNSLKKSGIDADCVKGGSIAKDTFLKGDHDIDLFVRFSLAFKGKQISEILQQALSEAFPGIAISRIHGSRDYFQFTKGRLDYEIIPVLRIHESNYSLAENVTDMSPEHVAWVERYTRKNPELNDEIRITKQFMKANKVYGAESFINGFSGHMVDILTIHYGSFLSLIKKFSSITDESLKTSLIIDHERHMKDPMKELNQSKITPLIVIDPIQKDRNAAAALSAEKLRTFITACRDFLKNPEERSFEIKKFDIEYEIKVRLSLLKRTKTKKSIRIIIIDTYPHKSSRDIMGTRVLKTYEDLKKQMLLNEFIILDDFWNFFPETPTQTASGVICYILDSVKLAEDIEQKGPPLNIVEDVKNFRIKHKKIYIKGNRIYSMIKRKYLLPEDLVNAMFNQEFVKLRMKKIIIRETRIL